MAAVAFDYAGWSARFPELAAYVPQALAQLYFNEVGLLYCDNSATSPITDDTVQGERYMLLNLATAHVAALNAPLNGVPSPTLVGRISNASEGSVSVAVESKYPEGTVQWWQQTKYGAAFWAGTTKYRLMQYFPPQRHGFAFPWQR